MTKNVQLAVIGGGPAGLAAADAAFRAGCRDILILERDFRLGGILNQCIHNGFGLHTFREELTGPEYAARYIEKIEEEGIPCLLNTMVTDLKRDGKGKKIITAMNREDGILTIRADAVILAMGCRERPRGAMNTPGFRPAGIFSAGTAQLYVNIHGRMPGRKAVIVGSGDIGLIMARRMILEGAEVKAVVEIMNYSGGLKRNIVQCLKDFDIPLLLGHTVVDIKGKERVSGVTVAAVNESMQPVEGTEQEIECDTVLYSTGLIPENELTLKLGAPVDPVSNGPVVRNSLEIDGYGVFACGNVLHVHDIVDHVTQEAVHAGENAAKLILEGAVPADAAGFIESAEKNVYRPGEGEDKLTCIRCPNGCELTVTKNERGEVQVAGNLCPKGMQYGIQEMTAPKRILTSTVRLSGASFEALPVKSAEEIPKEKLREVIESLRGLTVRAPVQVGDVILSDAADTGVDIVATNFCKNLLT